jgi:hypothetical protein
LELEQLVPYHRGVLLAPVALKKRLDRLGRSGRKALAEVDRYQAMARRYRDALHETQELKRQEG